MSTPRVHTYHCQHCSNLFLASTHDFKILPKRKPPGLDKATIVPLPPPPKSDKEEGGSDTESSEESSSSSESESEAEGTPKPSVPAPMPKELSPNEPPPPTAPFDPEKTALVQDTEATKGGAGPPPKPPATRGRREGNDYTLLLSLTKDRSAKIITREDGFEKRWIWRCGRCKLIVGYQLDDAHFLPNANTHSNTIVTTGPVGGDAGAEKDRAEKERRRAERKRKRYLYILPDACVATEELGQESASG